jgi:lipopolysaccharide export system permease protein
MLKTIDWYIIRKFLSTFFFTVLIFTMIGIIIDFSEKVEKFIEEPITNAEIWLEYYPSFFLFLMGLLWPVFALVAVIFFTSRMAYSSEIISIFNAGVSFFRLMRPYMFSAAFLTFLYLLGTHFFIPWGEQHRLRVLRKYIDKNDDKGKTTDVHLFIAPNAKVYIGNYRKDDSTARDFRIEQFRDHQLVQLVKADLVEWQKDTKKWRLRDYQIQTFDSLKESLVIGYGKMKDTTLNLNPGDFVDYSRQQSTMLTPTLVHYIRQQISRGAGNVRKYQLELNRRTADPFTIFILTIMGMAIAARKVRGGIGLHLALGIALGAIYIFLSKFTTVFAMGQAIPVWLGVWLPNIIFMSVAFWMVGRAQK